MKMINVSGKVGIDVMMKLCQRVLDGKGMLEDWKISVIVPICKGKVVQARHICRPLFKIL